MTRAKDSTIQSYLHRIVRQAVDKDEEITVRKARSRVEDELKLGEGFFKNDEVWKKRSQNVIHAAYQEDSVESELIPKTPAQPKTPEASRIPSNTNPTKPKPQQGTNRLERSNSGGADGVGRKVTASAPANETALNKPNKVPPQVNGVKRKAGESGTSEEESQSAQDSSTESEQEADGPRKKKSRTKSSSGSGESSEADSDADSTRNSSNKAEDTVKPESPKPLADEPTQSSLQAIPTKPYRPPLGFTEIASNFLADDNAFSQTSLHGKQIWHIAAPSSVPLSSIKDVALDAIQSGQPVLNHQGIDYILTEDPSQSNNTAALLIPSKYGFQRIEQQVDRTLKLRQKIVLPNLTMRQADQMTGSKAAADVGEPPVSNVRPQPKGLRMRYKPPGFGPGRPGRIGSGSESTDEDHRNSNKPGFQFPKTLGAHEASVPQGSDARDADIVTGANSKKSKKKRKDKEASESAIGKGNGVLGSNAESSAKSKLVDRSFSSNVHEDSIAAGKALDNEPPVTDGISSETLSKDERRRLKQERKEARRKAKEAKA